MADIQAQTPDGVTHSFPDGTPDDVIDRVVKNHIQNVMPYTEKGAAAAPPVAGVTHQTPAKGVSSGNPLGVKIGMQEAEEPSNEAIGRATGAIGLAVPAVVDPLATAGAVVGGASGAYGGGKAGRYLGGETGETIGKVAGGLGGSILGGGAGANFEGLPEESSLFGMKFKTPNFLRKSPFEPSEGYSNPLGPEKGEFEAQHEAQLIKEGKLANIPTRMPRPKTPAPPVDEVAQAVKNRTANWIPNKVTPPLEQELPLPSRAHAEMEQSQATAATKTPEAIARRGMAVGKAKSALVHGRPFEQLNEQEQAEALMRRGREQQQIEAGAPVEGSNQRPITVPEPNPVQPGEKPGAQWSVKRRTDLIQNAKRGKEGAATVLNQLNKPVIYEPRGVVGTNPREVTTFGEGGEPGGGTVGKGPIKGGKAGLEGMGKGEQARAQLHAQLEKDTGVNVHDFVDKFMEKNPKATRGQAYDIAEETLRDLSGGKYVNEIERQMSQERLNRIMGPEQRGPQRLGPEHRGTK